jgi:hypothetical protein
LLRRLPPDEWISVTPSEIIEEKISNRIAASGIRLRYDRVAMRLLSEVKAVVAQVVPVDQSIAFTITAPIKRPAKTSATLQERLRQLRTSGLSTTINGNEIRARIVIKTSSNMPRVTGFVHNPESNADLILDIAEASLRER